MYTPGIILYLYIMKHYIITNKITGEWMADSLAQKGYESDEQAYMAGLNRKIKEKFSDFSFINII